MWSFATQRRTVTSSSSRHSFTPGSGTGTRLPRGREFAGWAWTRDSDVLGDAELPLAVRQSVPDGARGALPGQDDKPGAGRREVEIADGCRWPCTAVRSPCRDWLAAAPSEEPRSKHRGRGHPPGFAILFAQASCALRPEAPRDSSPRAPSHASIACAATTPEHQSPAVSTPRRRSRPRLAPPAAPSYVLPSPVVVRSRWVVDPHGSSVCLRGGCFFAAASPSLPASTSIAWCMKATAQDHERLLATSRRRAVAS